MFSKGDRVRITGRMDDIDPIPLGTEGTVTRFADFGDWSQLAVKWDNGRSLMLTFPEDLGAVHVIS